jgi:hypothetical protein
MHTELQKSLEAGFMQNYDAGCFCHSREGGNPELPEFTKIWIPDYYLGNDGVKSVQMTMADMAQAVDKFLTFNEYRLLTDKGRISKAKADDKALAEYAEFNRTQKIESDFDRMVKATQALGQGKKK